MATGPFQVPRVPALAADLDPAVFQTHSVGYRNPGELPDGPVLVVGGGNTGFQIAEELAADRETHLSVGSRQMPLPQRIGGRDLFWWLGKLGILEKSIDTKLGRRLSTRDTLIGSSPRAAKRAGVTMHGRAVGASGRTVVFEDGSTLDVAAAIWATGYRFDHSWIDLPITDADGKLVHRRGVTGRSRPLLPRPSLAAHARLRARRLGEGRRRVHRGADRRARSGLLRPPHSKERQRHGK